MPSVTFNLDAKLLTEVDKAALEREVSRSRFIVNVMRAYFAPKEPSSFEVKLLENQIEHKNELITLREAEIADLKELNGRFWLSYNECNERLVQYQLPPPAPKKSWWSRLRGRS